MGAEPSRRGLWDRAEARRATAGVLADFGHPEIDPDARRGPPADRRAAGGRDLPRDGGPGPRRAHGRADEQPAARRRRPALRARSARLAGGGRGRRLHQPLPRGDAGGGVGLHGPARRPDGRRRARSPTTTNDAAHRPHGGPRPWASCSRGARAARPPSVALEVEGLAAPGLHEASFTLRRGRGPRRLRPHGLRPHGDGAGAVRPRAGPRRARRPGPAGRRRRLAPRPPGGSREGFGYLSEDRKGEGLALPLSVADNVTLTRLSSCSRGGVLDLRRAARAGRGAGRRARRADARAGPARAHAVRRRTSRRSPSPGSSTRTRTCSCSTSRRAASTWRARPQIYEADRARRATRQGRC